ncbi:MAG: DNA polymerase Y family protein [Burkholderiaceae bacterium]|nr:DNA polymerase Y family protein [Burkholderiaceae bacterium]MDO9088961.1 DNA polymerase Y family protein [Burkholderiaceae bacterium]
MHWIALQALPPEAGAHLPEDDAPALQRALGWQALRFTPRVTLLDEAVLLEVSASARLFGGLRALVAQLMAECSVQRAHGPTAWVALARLRLRQGSGAIDALPLRTLSAAQAHLAVLERIGCLRWGDLRGLPRAGVARRFGQPLLDALDRAYGLLSDSHEWLVPPEVFDDTLELPALVESAPALMFAAQRLLVRMQAWLRAHGSGLLALALVWHLDARRDVPPCGELVIRLGEPAQDMAHVGRLIAEHLAHTSLPAPVHTLGLRSLDIAPLAPASQSLFDQAQRQGDSLAQFIERASARLGPGRLRCWVPHASHVPERMQRWVNAQDEIAALGARLHRAQREPVPQLRPEALYPAWLLDRPQRLRTQADRPLYHGELRLLAGPQRLETSGWAAQADAPAEDSAQRDYFIARSEQAGLLWIYRERPTGGRLATAWYLHGIVG